MPRRWRSSCACPWHSCPRRRRPTSPSGIRHASTLYKDGRYSEALKSYVQASESPDPATALDARKGIVLAALRVGEFTLARRTASVLSSNDRDAEALTLSGDALWAAGFFDEADREYARALAVDTNSARARYGIARSLSSRSRLAEALTEVEGAIELAPLDSDLPALQGTVLERLSRFGEAAKRLRRVREPVAEA